MIECSVFVIMSRTDLVGLLLKIIGSAIRSISGNSESGLNYKTTCTALWVIRYGVCNYLLCAYPSTGRQTELHRSKRFGP